MAMRLHFACSLVLAASTVNADDPPSAKVEEIIVKAGFHERTLMRTAGSISVIDREELAERAATHLEQTLAVAPNVNFAVGGSRARFIQMRGIGDLEQFTDPKHFPSVGITMDGIELSNVASGALLLDTEQVEVLRGPQGTRFGASALAGMINIRGREPGDAWEAETSAGYGNLDTWHVGGAAGGPLSDTLRARVAVRQTMSDGFVDNDFLGRDDTQDIDELAARGRFVWDLTPALQADLTTLYIDADNGYDVFSLANTRHTSSDEPGRDAQRAGAIAGRVSLDLGRAGTLQALSTWTDGKETYGFDEDWIFRGFCDGVRCDPALEFSSSDTVTRNRDQVTVDLRWLADAGPSSWVTGAYLHHRDEAMQRQRFGLFDSDYETSRYALYGQVEVTLGTALTARLGIRGEAFDDGYDDTNLVDTQSNATFWSGEATLEYQARPATLLYATLARGAKPGGVNTSATSVAPFVDARFDAFTTERLRFDTETLFNKELGIKGSYFDGRMTTRWSVFHMDRSNAQLENWIWDATNFIFVGLLDNVDDAENYGIEMGSEFDVTEAVSVAARVGYLETNIESMDVFDIDRNDFAQIHDRDQAKAPRWQYHFEMNWQVLPPLRANIAIEGRDRSFFGYYHDQRLDGYALVNAALRYRYRQAEVRLWARNLLNTEYAVHGLYFANDPRDAFTVNRTYTQFGEPRVYGIEVNWSL